MDQLTVTETTWRGTDAWMIAGPELEAVVTKIGAHLAAVRAPGEELNPLWQPPWKATTPEEGASRPGVYGDGPEASLLAGIVGHNLCLDRFGPPRPGERRPVHGEAGVSRWNPDTGAPDRVTLLVRLEEADLRVGRAFEIDADRLVVTTSVVHTSDSPREIEWAEHVTIGDPFLDGAVFEADAEGAWISGAEPRETTRFPDVEAESPVDPQAVLSMPPSSDSRAAGDIATVALRRGRFRAVRADLGRALEYEWNADEFPWLCVWTQHRSRTAPPWNGRTRARGMEFSTKPFPEGEPPPERSQTFHDRPVTCLVPPGPGLRRSFTVRWGQA